MDSHKSNIDLLTHNLLNLTENDIDWRFCMFKSVLIHGWIMWRLDIRGV
jgi:hypothetical protein